MNSSAPFPHPPHHSDVPRGRWKAPSSASWDPAPEEASVAEDEVHVWAAGLDADTSQLEAYRCTISEAESARAARFFGGRERDRYVVSRGVLREVLGLYMGMTPREICLRVDRWGKPALTSLGDRRPLRFSISHSVDVLMVAVVARGQVGIDVEWIDQSLDWRPVAEQILPETEVSAVQKLPEAQQRAAFYSLWTQWEALSKAIGCGLTLPRTTIAPVSCHGILSGREHAILRGPQGALWRTRIFTPLHGYVAALAVEYPSVAQMKFYMAARPPRGA